DCKSKIGDMRGDFRAILLAKSLPYTSKRPGEPFMARPVRECKSSKKWNVICQGQIYPILKFLSRFYQNSKRDSRVLSLLLYRV
ncbi:MAG: hypothetical protein IJB81_13970, partial [Clostridia bacterium]|nr:hypothetical protein [Clostridia bacterium]